MPLRRRTFAWHRCTRTRAHHPPYGTRCCSPCLVQSAAYTYDTTTTTDSLMPANCVFSNYELCKIRMQILRAFTRVKDSVFCLLIAVKWVSHLLQEYLAYLNLVVLCAILAKSVKHVGFCKLQILSILLCDRKHHFQHKKAQYFAPNKGIHCNGTQSGVAFTHQHMRVPTVQNRKNIGIYHSQIYMHIPTMYNHLNTSIHHS